MQIDILLFAEIISALTVIGGLIFGIFKFIENNKKQNTEIKKIKKRTDLDHVCSACLS